MIRVYVDMLRLFWFVSGCVVLYVDAMDVFCVPYVDDLSVRLPFSGDVKVSVEWGDGTSGVISAYVTEMSGACERDTRQRAQREEMCCVTSVLCVV